MSKNTPGNPRKYVGENRTLIPFVTRPRRPTSADYRQPETGNYYIYGSIWQVGPNPTTGTFGELWMLQKIVANEGCWVLVSSGIVPGGPILTLSDTANTLVYPTIAGNVQIEAGPGIDVTADAGNNKLVISTSGGGTAVDTFSTNVSGPVVPTALGEVLVNASTTTYTDGSVANTLVTEVQGTNHALFVGRGTNTPAANLSVGATGHTLIGATGADPQFAAIGTNSGLTNHGVVIAQNNGAFIASSAVTTHALLMGTTGSDPDWTTSGTPYVSGISFDSGTNTLQRYINTSSFTPVVYGSTGAGTANYTEQSGRYSVIGNMVFFNINLLWDSHTGTGDMMISGFPYIFAAAQSFYPAVCMAQNIVFPASTAWITMDGVNNTTTAEITASVDNAVFANVQMDAAGSLHISGWYPTAP